MSDTGEGSPTEPAGPSEPNEPNELEPPDAFDEFEFFYDAENNFESELDVIISFQDVLEALSEVAESPDAADQAPRLRVKVRALGSKLRLKLKELWRPRHILLKDKVAFLLGCTLLWGCAFWLGRSPQSFYKLYTGLGLALFAIRWVTYRRRRFHYYLFDFCYWANLLLLLHLWVLPHSAVLQQATFAFNTGPLTWSILAFRNSLVFHDMDKVTSLFLHLVPALVSWSLHWYPEDGRFAQHAAQEPPAPACSAQDGRLAMVCLPDAPLALQPRPRQLQQYWAEALRFVLVPMLLYLTWATLYYLKIFVFSARKIQQRGYQTLFKFVTSQSQGVFHDISKHVPQNLQPQVYLFLHLCFCLCTLLVALPCWSFFAGHTALLVSVATTSIWAGASYYFEIFARRYHASISEAMQAGA